MNTTFMLVLRRHQPFVLLLLVYLLVAALFAIFTPAWQNPDEPAHYNYIAQLARGGCCPVIQIGDWDSAYLEQLKSSHFAPDLLGNLGAVQYEDHQPPLYYLLLTPLFTLTNGSLIALRLASVVMGAGIVCCAYALGLLVIPRRPQVALAAAALVAFLPQHVAVLASVNNDALANLLIAAVLLACTLYLRRRDVQPLHIGLLVGLALLTKVSALFVGGVAGLCILWRWWRERHDGAGLLRPLLAFALPALLMGGLWWGRSISVYGFPDVYGLRQHNLVVADQPRTADLIAQIGFPAYLEQALTTTYHSFLGQFGWMALPMPSWIYALIGLLLLVCLGGLLLAAWGAWRSPPDAGWEAAGILGLVAVLAVLAYAYYNTEFLQFQGRYMFTGLVPFALGLALGLDTLRARIIRRGAWLTVLPFALFALLDVYLLWRVIVPGLT